VPPSAAAAAAPESPPAEVLSRLEAATPAKFVSTALGLWDTITFRVIVKNAHTALQEACVTAGYRPAALLDERFRLLRPALREIVNHFTLSLPKHINANAAWVSEVQANKLATNVRALGLMNLKAPVWACLNSVFPLPTAADDEGEESANADDVEEMGDSEEVAGEEVPASAPAAPGPPGPARPADEVKQDEGTVAAQLRDEVLQKAKSHVKTRYCLLQGKFQNVDFGAWDGKAQLVCCDLPYLGQQRLGEQDWEVVRAKTAAALKPGGMVVLMCNIQDFGGLRDVFEDKSMEDCKKGETQPQFTVCPVPLTLVRNGTYNANKNTMVNCCEFALVGHRTFNDLKKKTGTVGKAGTASWVNRAGAPVAGPSTGRGSLLLHNNDNSPVQKGYLPMLGNFANFVEPVFGPGGWNSQLWMYQPADPGSRLRKQSDPKVQWRPLAEKPLPLLQRMVLAYTKKGDLIVDFTCGTGSMGIAGLSLDRSFLGADSDAPALIADATARAVVYTANMLLLGGKEGNFSDLVKTIDVSPGTRDLIRQCLQGSNAAKLLNLTIMPAHNRPSWYGTTTTLKEALVKENFVRKKSGVPTKDDVSPGFGLFVGQAKQQDGGITKGDTVACYWGRVCDIRQFSKDEPPPKDMFVLSDEAYESVTVAAQYNRDGPEWAHLLAQPFTHAYVGVAPHIACTAALIQQASRDQDGLEVFPYHNVVFAATKLDDASNTAPYRWIPLTAVRNILPGEEIICRSYGGHAAYDFEPVDEKTQPAKRKRRATAVAQQEVTPYDAPIKANARGNKGTKKLRVAEAKGDAKSPAKKAAAVPGPVTGNRASGRQRTKVNYSEDKSSKDGTTRSDSMSAGSESEASQGEPNADEGDGSDDEGDDDSD
jgi:hypothetical protein